VFIWAAGNDSESVFRFGGKMGKTEKTIIVHSGDCVVFEGQTWHTVRRCKPNTSPLRNSSWLHNRRLSVLVRQNGPKTKPKRPSFLKK
jgi:hypothetical protein